MKYQFLSCLILFALLGSAVPAFSDEPAQRAEQLDIVVKVQLKYLLYLPKDYDKQEKVPLLLFLHGSGERGDNLDLVKVHGPPKLIAQGKDFPFIVVSPQCPKEQWWEPYQLVALLDDLISKYKVDTERICVTGLSMGGFGTWRLAAAIPKRLAAIVPICGGGEVFMARRMSKLSVWAFHGAKDKGVPVELSQTMVDAINKKDGHAKLTVYPDAEHDSWTQTYEDPALYEWLLAQRRAPDEKEKEN